MSGFGLKIVLFLLAQAAALGLVWNQLELEQTEQLLIENLKKYLFELRQRHQMIKKTLHQLRAESGSDGQFFEIHLSVPQRAMALIRRLHEDWPNWMVYLNATEGGEGQIIVAKELRQRLPKREDFIQAANDVHKLQITYNLRPHDQYFRPLNSRDCLALGTYLAHQKNHQDAEEWLKLSLKLYRAGETKNRTSFYKDAQYEHLLYHLGVTKYAQNPSDGDALKLIAKAYALAPHDEQIVDHAQYMLEQRPYFDGCRGAFPTKSHHHSLHCRYYNKGSAFSRLAPLKLEIFSHDPYVGIYHDVLYDTEMQGLIDSTRRRMSRSMVQYEIRQIEISEQRTSKEAPFTEKNDPQLLKRIYDRLKDMTGCDMLRSEHLSILLYDQGGHHDPHVDYHDLYWHPQEYEYHPFGDRQASVVFYLNDVEDGGETVFPKLQLVIPPTKGSALMWHNLRPWGEGDPRTQHASCPVLSGYKQGKAAILCPSVLTLLPSLVAIQWILQGTRDLVTPKDVLSKRLKSLQSHMGHAPLQ
ncbi:prolyl 4-hydroxylase subunit alpha-2-like isoform X1 [Drosophila miranda]|uniref:prolyl 4-hydroxylase subunit alpha-2-like isoform X1 n=1 Tax=Drosophila miranda TaxID=7229 RepID=UPI0007E8A63E|nr:prolyl 4-hydroxylase subunit alpha-2-like isoform X1 [Drosophila miranda]